jgi:hypothetical protein
MGKLGGMHFEVLNNRELTPVGDAGVGVSEPLRDE